MTRKEQITNGFTEMMRGFWGNQNLKTPDPGKMTAEKNLNKQLIDELSKMPPMVIETAYLYAINYITYGEDITEKWVTAIRHASILEKAYRKGYYDALQSKLETEHKE